MCVESTLKIIRWLHDRADRSTEQRHHGKEHFDDTEMSRPERLCCYRPLLGEKCAQVHKVPPPSVVDDVACLLHTNTSNQKGWTRKVRGHLHCPCVRLGITTSSNWRKN